MSPFTRFFQRTWWLWLIYAALFIALAILITPLFYIGLILLVPYAIYFAIVRGPEDDAAPKR